jgi:hypothetical protein
VQNRLALQKGDELALPGLVVGVVADRPPAAVGHALQPAVVEVVEGVADGRAGDALQQAGVRLADRVVGEAGCFACEVVGLGGELAVRAVGKAEDHLVAVADFAVAVGVAPLLLELAVGIIGVEDAPGRRIPRGDLALELAGLVIGEIGLVQPGVFDPDQLVDSCTIPCLHRLGGEQQLQAADIRTLAAVVLADEEGRFGQTDIRLLDAAEVLDNDSGKTQLPLLLYPY